MSAVNVRRVHRVERHDLHHLGLRDVGNVENALQPRGVSHVVALHQDRLVCIQHHSGDLRARSVCHLEGGRRLPGGLGEDVRLVAVLVGSARAHLVEREVESMVGEVLNLVAHGEQGVQVEGLALHGAHAVVRQRLLLLHVQAREPLGAVRAVEDAHLVHQALKGSQGRLVGGPSGVAAEPAQVEGALSEGLGVHGDAEVVEVRPVRLPVVRPVVHDHRRRERGHHRVACLVSQL
mmetsp:Transcript_33634/g.73413  ORF Transcript_33634/g.73413 Transcript_33634/m.73413 type:complete len:235 (-) Transcript_33634:6521-7225(-)